MILPGMPDGVDAVRFGQLAEQAAKGAAEWVLGDNATLFTSGFGLIVEMLPNWTAEYSEERRQFHPVEHYEPRRIITIEVADSIERTAVEAVKGKVEASREKANSETLSTGAIRTP